MKGWNQYFSLTRKKNICKTFCETKKNQGQCFSVLKHFFDESDRKKFRNMLIYLYDFSITDMCFFRRKKSASSCCYFQKITLEMNRFSISKILLKAPSTSIRVQPMTLEERLAARNIKGPCVTSQIARFYTRPG